MTFLNQSTCARQWSKACINSCATTRFIWDCWRMLFWHRTICRRDIGSLFTKFLRDPCRTPTAIRLFRSMFFIISSPTILQCPSSARFNTSKHLSHIYFQDFNSGISMNKSSSLFFIREQDSKKTVASPVRWQCLIWCLPEMWQNQNLHWHSHHSFRKKSAGHWRQCWKAQMNKVCDKVEELC